MLVAIYPHLYAQNPLAKLIAAAKIFHYLRSSSGSV
jgi:hypothetical protein